MEALKKMQRYFTLQIFECFDIPIDDLWAEFELLDGMRMRTRMHSFFVGTQFYELHFQHGDASKCRLKIRRG